MKKTLRKLMLSRETLMPLQRDELVAVNGGTLSVAVGVSIRACAAASAAATKAVCPKVFEGAKWAASAVSAGVLGNRVDDMLPTKKP
jgi:hypothetical protein